jgi:hypothetical protein
MTQNGTESRPAIPVGLQIGQVVGQAQSVLSGLLAGVLERTQTKNETYLALQRMALLGGEASRDGYVRDLSDWLSLNLRDAGELADSLIAAGLLTAADGTVRLSDAGAELRASIVGSMGAITTPLWGAFDPADLETTVTTLREIATRARALSSTPPATSGAGEGRS